MAKCETTEIGQKTSGTRQECFYVFFESFLVRLASWVSHHRTAVATEKPLVEAPEQPAYAGCGGGWSILVRFSTLADGRDERLRLTRIDGRFMGKSSKSTVNVFVALLRGVNVGGNNMIRMSELKTSFERAGFTDVSTYINSGNILFKAQAADARKLERKIEKMLLTEYQLDCKVVVRSYFEMADLVENLPRNWNRGKDWKYNVMFLRHSIDSEAVLGQLAPKPNIERVVYCPGTLLWSARTRDLTRTTMLKLAGKKIYQYMTVRNTNTTKKLYELMKRMMED